MSVSVEWNKTCSKRISFRSQCIQFWNYKMFHFMRLHSNRRYLFNMPFTRYDNTYSGNATLNDYGIEYFPSNNGDSCCATFHITYLINAAEVLRATI